MDNPSRRDDGNEFTIAEVFQYKGRTCVIVKLDPLVDVGKEEKRKYQERPFMPYLSPSHNGYVETMTKKIEEAVNNLKTEEITYSGDLSFYENKRLEGKIFLGFDSSHHYNFESPNTRTFEYVKKRTMKLCDEMIKRGY